MKAALVFCVILALASCHKQTKPLPKRRVVEAEHDPLRIKYLAYKGKDGRVRVENLQRTPTGPRAVISEVTFLLYTVNNAGSGELLRCEDINDLLNSAYYSPARQNVFVTHGWNSNGVDSEIGVSIKDALLATSDVNVFVTDWSGPASQFYTDARDDVPVIGGFIGGYISQMMSSYGLSGANFVMIGHSLGAHISGEVGATLGGTIDTIVGMDPAGPLFWLDEPLGRLDETDAAFVEVIHTNGALLGFQSAIGHADFYPNGGDWQPGCDFDVTGACSHGRSYQFMAESIRSGGFRSQLCDSWDSHTSGLCAGNQESMMGQYPADKSAFGDFYLTTSDAPPYALG